MTSAFKLLSNSGCFRPGPCSVCRSTVEGCGTSRVVPGPGACRGRMWSLSLTPSESSGPPAGPRGRPGTGRSESAAAHNDAVGVTVGCWIRARWWCNWCCHLLILQIAFWPSPAKSFLSVTFFLAHGGHQPPSNRNICLPNRANRIPCTSSRRPGKEFTPWAGG